jgi:hypothetical protein
MGLGISFVCLPLMDRYYKVQAVLATERIAKRPREQRLTTRLASVQINPKLPFDPCSGPIS